MLLVRQKGRLVIQNPEIVVVRMA